jgi:hypothetical protein
VMASDVRTNGAPLSLEQRLAAAQAEGLEPNVRRMLRFIGAAGVVELQAVGVRRSADDSYARKQAQCDAKDDWPFVPYRKRQSFRAARSQPKRRRKRAIGGGSGTLSRV